MLELVTAAREVSDSVSLGLITGGDAAAELNTAPDVESILGVRIPRDRPLDDATRARAVTSLLSQSSATLVLLPASWTWAAAAANAAVTHDMSLVSHCVSLEIASDGGLLVQRPIYGEKILAELHLPKGRPALALVKKGSWPAAELVSNSPRIDFIADISPDDGDVTHVEFIEPESDDEDLKNASIVFAVGRGLGTAEQIEIVSKAARKCGAALAASRPIVDMGLLPRSRQVGQSGLTVNPQIYVAFGISGAPQHLEGMRNSEVVVAINTDRDAPIFGAAHFGAFVDAAEVARILCDE